MYHAELMVSHVPKPSPSHTMGADSSCWKAYICSSMMSLSIPWMKISSQAWSLNVWGSLICFVSKRSNCAFNQMAVGIHILLSICIV